MLLPLPLSPTSAVTQPGRSVNETSETASQLSRRRPRAAQREALAEPLHLERAHGAVHQVAGDAVARLQLAQPRPLARAAAGAARASTPVHFGQRGWKRQPDGGLREVGRRAGDARERDDRPGQRRERAHEPVRVRVQRGCGRARPRRRLDDLAGVHDRDAVAELDEQREVVRDEQHGEAEPLLEHLELLQDLALHDDVERGRRLVHHDQLRLERERHRDHDALAHAARELVRIRAHALALDARRARAGRPRARARRSCARGRGP